MPLKFEHLRNFMLLRSSQITEIADQIGVSSQEPRELNAEYARRVLVEAASTGKLDDLIDWTLVCTIINANG